MVGRLESGESVSWLSTGTDLGVGYGGREADFSADRTDFSTGSATLALRSAL